MRFEGIQRLYGLGSLEVFRGSHVAVIGIGGVGSWSAESLVRSGIGRLTLVDLDDICISNTNRQLHTTHHTIGRQKVQVMAERLMEINPECDIRAMSDFLTETSLPQLLDPPYDYIIDAIDSLHNKVHLINHCIESQQAVVTIGGAGGKINPTKVETADLANTTNDGLLRKLRRELRLTNPSIKHGLPYGIPAVYSHERPRFVNDNGEITAISHRANNLNCSNGFGSASFVTATFGMAAVAKVLQDLVKAPEELQTINHR